MKKTINIPALILILIFFSTAAYGSDISTRYPDDMADILNRGKLIVGIYCKDKPPFVMTNKKGELYGFDIDISKDIARKLGIDIEFNKEATTYTKLHQLAVEEKIDVIICKFSRTYQRAKNLRFTIPYLTLRRAVLVNKMFAAKNGITDYPMDFLKKSTVAIGVREKTSYVEFAKNMFPKAEIVEGKWEQLVEDLRKGDLQAVVRDEYVIRKLIKTNPDMALDLSVYILKDQKDYIAMAVSPKNTQLLHWLNMYLETKALNKNVEDIMREYPEIFKDK